tara:strand:- start:5543 stop:6253 length:711 start_codon:yes stop_codon:yes gene_type:complete
MTSTTFAEGSLKGFIVMTIILYFIKIIGIDRNSNEDNKKNNINQLTFVIIISVLFFLYLMGWNIYLTSNEIVCGETGIILGVQATIFPFVFIYGLGIFLLEMFPGWLRSFANTHGTFVAEHCGLSLDDKLFVSKDDRESDILKKVYNDKSKLLNELHEDNYNKAFQNNKDIFQNDALDILHKYVTIKESFARFLWVIFLGSITLMVSQNALLNENCSKKIEDRGEFKEYLESQLQG